MTDDYGHLLIVANDKAVQGCLRDHLEGCGYTTIGAHEGHQALTMLQVQRFDLVLVALDLADMEGTELVRTLKADPELRAIPVFVLGPHQHIDRLDECISCGAEDHVDPESSLLVLQSRVRTHLERIRLCSPALVNREKERLLVKIEHDLQIGHDIQSSFLPKDLPSCGGWKIARTYKPAREVGGDLYDVFLMTQTGPIGLIIGDVCDKGVGAALFMALFRSFFRAIGQQRYLLSAALEADMSLESTTFISAGTTVLKRTFELVNNYVIDNHGEQGYFVTLFFGVLEPASGKLLYVNGGHVPALILGPDGIKSRLTSTGPAVGIMPHAAFEIKQAHMEPGDIFFAYTDGVTDARDPQRQFFSEQRLHALVERSASTAKDLLEHVDTTIKNHIAGAEQYDDITMLVMERVLRPVAAAAEA